MAAGDDGYADFPYLVQHKCWFCQAETFNLACHLQDKHSEKTLFDVETNDERFARPSEHSLQFEDDYQERGNCAQTGVHGHNGQRVQESRGQVCA